jgi:hypothetical protein
MDGIHLVTTGYDQLGEKFGEVFFEKVVMGQDWQPLQPTTATRAGSTVTVKFHVPVGPLAWDDNLPSPHPTGYPQWATGRGFEVTLDGNPVAISKVALAGSDSVQITCGADVSKGQLTVSYAFVADGMPMPNGTARWGHLRDSDPFMGAMTHTANPNYCVSFSMTVP